MSLFLVKQSKTERKDFKVIDVIQAGNKEEALVLAQNDHQSDDHDLKVEHACDTDVVSLVRQLFREVRDKRCSK